jgi:peptidoglycan hydrolase CwlO-like protein
METELQKQLTPLELFSLRATRWIGSINSLIVHTVLFVVSFILVIFGIDFDKILLVVTTIVSLEAIYLAIFIQMSVNRQGRRLHAVSKDIDEIQEDIDEIQEDVEKIEKDVDEIQEDVEEIQEDVEEIGEDVEEIQENVEVIGEDVGDITSEDEDEEKRYERIEKNLEALMQEISKLKKHTK